MDIDQTQKELLIQKLRADMAAVWGRYLELGSEFTSSQLNPSHVAEEFLQIIKPYLEDRSLDPDDIQRARSLVEKDYLRALFIPMKLSGLILDERGNLASILKEIATFAGNLIYINGGYPNSAGRASIDIFFEIGRPVESSGIRKHIASRSSDVLESNFTVEQISWATVDKLNANLIPFPHFKGQYQPLQLKIADQPGSLAVELQELANTSQNVKSILAYRLGDDTASIILQLEPLHRLKKSEA